MGKISEKLKYIVLNCTVKFDADEIVAYALRFCCDAEYSPNHAHSNAEIHIVTSGCKKYILNSGGEILLKPGQILLIGPNVFHSEMSMSDETVTGHCMSFYVKTGGNGKRLFDTAPYYYIESDNEKVVECFLDLEKELFEESSFSTGMVQGYLAVLYGKLLKLCDAEHSREEKTDFGKPQRNIIDEYFNGFFLKKPLEYTAEELSEQLHMSPRHLNRVLNRLYGMSFNERLAYIKLKYAEEQLLRSDKSIVQISEECCWSEKYFIREFKKHHGMTPLQFKKNYTKRTQI